VPQKLVQQRQLGGIQFSLRQKCARLVRVIGDWDDVELSQQRKVDFVYLEVPNEPVLDPRLKTQIIQGPQSCLENFAFKV
jgi:hypothetical protein